MVEKKISADDRRQNLSFFHLMFPAVLLAIISFIPSCSLNFGVTVIVIVVKLLLVIWQGVALKNFIESVYN
jgi:hypothetical protein